MKTGGELIVEALAANGAERLFCVPGKAIWPYWTRSMMQTSA